MSIFHSPEFVALNGLTLLKGSQTACMLLLGPARGTYGGFSYCASLEDMEYLLALRKIPACTVKLAPAAHDQELFTRSLNVLHRAGFMLEHVDLNYGMGELHLPFAERVNAGARKKLAKCDRAGFVSRMLDFPDWELAHGLLQRNRERAGRSLALPLQIIDALETQLPGSHTFFGTFDGESMVAAAITLMVRPDILYVYAWGDADKNEYAPTVHLCRAIYEEAATRGCKLLDAGTSTEQGVPNVGLIRFKESLGFTSSVKATMVRR